MRYQVLLSSNRVIEIDDEDFEKIKREVGSGNLIQVKRGILNPSFIVAIVPKETETARKVEGYIDEKTRRFVVTDDNRVVPELDNAFAQAKKKLTDGK